jgi:predicted N-acyltransferase
MYITVVDSIERVAPGDWDALSGGHNPFICHAFLAALERSGCVGAASGWLPQHLLIHDGGARGRTLVGAVPVYLKSHSYGEYVFDWAWASAYERAGLDYYPKLVVAVPFTPVTGPRLLTSPGKRRSDTKRALVSAVLALAREAQVSSLHWLFVPAQDVPMLAQAGHMRRSGCQFHWRNPGYQSFEQLLSEFSSAKRKKIRQERRYVRDAGVKVEIITGADIKTAHWDTFHRFYESTIHRYGAIPYLNRDFFFELGESMSEHVVLALARQHGAYIAGALNLRGQDTLYGRYWGSERHVNGLHFEVCYYSAMEYCIARGLSRFEAGAQGEHKLARGFRPTTTYSAHWLSHAEFGRAIGSYLERERIGVDRYIDELNGHSPFRQSN